MGNTCLRKAMWLEKNETSGMWMRRIGHQVSNERLQLGSLYTTIMEVVAQEPEQGLGRMLAAVVKLVDASAPFATKQTPLATHAATTSPKIPFTLTKSSTTDPTKRRRTASQGSASLLNAERSSSRLSSKLPEVQDC